MTESTERRPKEDVRPRWYVWAFWSFARPAGWVVAKLLYGFRIEGDVHRLRTGMARDGTSPQGVLLAANHESLMDPVLIGSSCSEMVWYTPRTSLGSNLLYRVITKFCPIEPIDRGSADLRATRRIVARLKAGQWVAIFPEETRTRDGELGPFKTGFHFLARRAKVPVVPVHLEGPFEIWPRHRTLPRLRGHIRIRYGEPMELWRLGRDEATEALREAIQRLASEPEHGSTASS